MSEQPAANAATVDSPFGKPEVLGKLGSGDITESSGIAVSKCQAGVFFTHNDSGDGPYVFAFDGKGGDLGTWKIQNAQNTDWEDIAEYKDASGQCFLYLGEIGDNAKKRPEHIVYRVREPAVQSGQSSDRKSPLVSEPADAAKFRYPDGNWNAETLMVNQQTGDVYVLSKRTDGPSGVYKFKPEFGSDTVVTAQKIAEIAVPSIPNGLLTGGDISPDGRRVVICDYESGYELALPAGDPNFDDIWKQPIAVIDLGKREQGEAIGYSTDGNTIYATSEGKYSPLIELQRRPPR
jgi:hypothetical protein